jgi:hypothetical protein
MLDIKSVFLVCIYCFALNLAAQRQSLFSYYQTGDRLLNPTELTQFNQLSNSLRYSEIKVASVRYLGAIKEGKEFDVNYGEQVKTVKEDFLISKDNGEYQITGVIGEDDINGFTSFTCNYSINFGVTGSIINEITQEFYQIIPITKSPGDLHLSPEVFVCKWFPNKYSGKNRCSTPPNPPEPEDGDDNYDPIETRTNCNRNIRVLFLFTNRAAVSGHNPATVANSVINELNASVGASETNQPTAEYENAGAINIPSFITFTDIDDDLDALVNDPIAQALRNENFADIVVLLTDQPAYTFNGTAKDIKTNNNNAYSIAQIAFANFGFTGSHEIAHLMGCRHQRCVVCGGGFLGLTSGCDEFGRGHGYKLCNTGRTIMYQNGCDSRTRIARISNDNSDFMGCSSGNYWNNNIRSMRNHACNVANFRPRPVVEFDEFTIMIDGASTGNQCEWSEWRAVIIDESSPLNNYIYKWEKSANGVNNWCTISSSPSINNFQLFNSCYTSNGFYLRLQVRLSTNQYIVEFDQKYISWTNCFDDNEVTENRSSLEKTVELYPNPSSNIITISNVDELIGIYNNIGQNMVVGVTESYENKIIDISILPDGVYFVVIQNKNKLTTKKFTKI